MRGAGRRVLVDADRGEEEARRDVGAVRRRRARSAARRAGAGRRAPRGPAAPRRRRRRRDLDQRVEVAARHRRASTPSAATRPSGTGSSTSGSAGRSSSTASPSGRARSSPAGVAKRSLPPRGARPRAEQHVRRRERAMPAERSSSCGPCQRRSKPGVGARHREGGRRQVERPSRCAWRSSAGSCSSASTTPGRVAAQARAREGARPGRCPVSRQSQLAQRKTASSAAEQRDGEAPSRPRSRCVALPRHLDVHAEEAGDEGQRQHRRAQHRQDPQHALLAVGDQRLVRVLERLDDLLVVVEGVPDLLRRVDQVVVVDLQVLVSGSGACRGRAAAARGAAG